MTMSSTSSAAPSLNADQGARVHAINIALIVVALVAMFWRVFFLGETLIDLRTLNNQLPWGAQAGDSRDYPYDRRDLTDMYVTREYFAAQAYRDGELPLWNPYTMAGHPIYADGVTRIFSPSLLLYKFFDVPLGYSLARIMELMLGGIFMYIFLIAIGASPRAGLMGSLVFVFSAHSMLHLSGLGWWGGLMWLPLILLFVERAIKRNRLTDSVAAGILLAAQFYCGYTPNEIYYVGAIALYYTFAALRGNDNRLSYGRALAMLLLTVGVGFAIAAPEWMPVAELLRQSNRRIVPTEIGYIYLPPWYLATFIFPHLFGSAYDATALRIFTAVGVSHDHILYIGVAALAPLLFGLFYPKFVQTGEKVRRDQRESFFLMLLGISLVAMMAAPLYVYLTRFVPVLQTIRVIVRAGVLFIFAASVLAALGVDRLFAANRDALAKLATWWKRGTGTIFILVVLTTIAAYGLRSASRISADSHGVAAFARRAVDYFFKQFTPPNAALLIPLALLIMTAFLIAALSKDRITPRVFYCALLVLLVGDLFWKSAEFNPTFNGSKIFPKTEMTELIKGLPAGRVLITPSDLDLNRKVEESESREKIIAPPNTMLPYKIPVITGKDQLFPKWYRDYCSLIEPQSNLSHVAFDQSASRYFDLLNVRYVLTHDSKPAPNGRFIARAEGLLLYENPNAFPRAFVIGNAIFTGDEKESLGLLRSPGFDPKTSAIVLASRSLDGSPGLAPSTMIPAHIIEEHRNSLKVESETETDGWLVISDTYYPGWKASIDGQPTEIYRANHTMRAVKLAAGRHMVSFVFAPPILRIASYIALVALAASVLMIAAGWFMNRRSRLKRE